MATFVAPVNQLVDTKVTTVAEQCSPPRERRFVALLISTLTLFALAVNGYHPYADDGGLYLAGVKRMLDPTLYPNSNAFVMEPTRLSLFAPMVAGMVRLSHVNLTAMLLALHLATIFATLLAGWTLASRCWSMRSARCGAVTLLACWLALPVAGTAQVLMDPYLTARSISMPCMVLALIGALDRTEWNSPATRKSRLRGLWLWIVSIVLAAAMHPLMAAYSLGATLMLASVRSSSRQVRVLGTAALSSAALAIAACLEHAARPESADYRRIAFTRTYWFPAQWTWYELVGLAAPIAILAILAIVAWRRSDIPSRGQNLRTNDARVALTRMAVALGATACLVAALFSRAGTATHLIARMQPLRIFQIVYLIMVLALGATLGQFVLRRSLPRWAAAILVLGGSMFAAERNAFSHSQHIESPWITQQNPWVEAFLWIRSNTPKDALFALDADYINAPGEDAQCFRAIAERSSLPDYSKDGGEASIAPELTAEWKTGQQAQLQLSAPGTTDSMRIVALSPLGVGWLVLDARTRTAFHCPYINGAVKVCLLPQMQASSTAHISRPA